jgi:NADH-quinone oxidoreductase subunit J
VEAVLGTGARPPVGDLVVFFLLAALALGLGIFAMTRRNPVTAVMSMVGAFLGLSGLYATLSAHFLAVLQVLVYAGAIMVLFIFVVMILNREEVSRVSFRGIFTRVFWGTAVGGGYLTYVIVGLFARSPQVAAAPGPVPEGFGTVASIGRQLFTAFVFPFEAISVLLLVAIVGGVVVSRSHKQEEQAEEVAKRHEAIRHMIRDEERLGIGPVASAGADDPHKAAGAHH